VKPYGRRIRALPGSVSPKPVWEFVSDANATPLDLRRLDDAVAELLLALVDTEGVAVPSGDGTVSNEETYDVSPVGVGADQ
jgi:hypothetical protein